MLLLNIYSLKEEVNEFDVLQVNDIKMFKGFCFFYFEKVEVNKMKNFW